jgi:membrane protein
MPHHAGMTWRDRIPPRLREALQPAYPFVRAVQLWDDAGGLSMSAAVSFYGILSLAPLLLLLVALLGWWLDRDVLTHGLVSQIGAVIGPRGTAAIADTLAGTQAPEQGFAATLAGSVVLLFGATGVFSELQGALHRLWLSGRAPQPKPVWWHAATLRLRGVGYVLVFGFLMLVSLVISTLLTLFAGTLAEGFAIETFVRVLNELATFAVGTALFVGLMRLSSGPKPRMRYLLMGAFAGAILFTLGRQLMALYLSTAAVVSAYGAAGSLIVLLMWIYFSSAVLLLGAGVARALEEARSARDAAPQRALRWAPHSASTDTTATASSTASPQR